MRRFWPLLLFVVIFLISLSQYKSNQPVSSDIQNTEYQRIISLSPSVTETVYALGAGDRLIAVTDYCEYPPEAQALPSIGGYMDPSLETIVSLQPELVILLQTQQTLRQQLSALGIATHSVDTSTLNGVEAAIVSIGDLTHKQQQSSILLNDIHARAKKVQSKVADKPPVRTLISIAHYAIGEKLSTIYVAGQQDFYNDLLQLAGGQNVFTDPRIKVPSITEEGIIRLNPDVIIDVFPEADDHNTDMNLVKQQWMTLQAVNAVKDDRIHIIQHDYASVPGPRVFQLLTEFARLLHPELDWSDMDD